MRILHFSDIHIQAPLRSVPLREWIGKRLFGGLNLVAGRRHHFAGAIDKVAALNAFRIEEDVQLVLCTGDYTALGTRRELQMARTAVAPLMQAPLGFVHVPGNHDVYSADVIRDGRFDESFGDTLFTDLPEYCVDQGRWPLVRLIAEDIAVVAVDSTRPNPQPWRSSGVIPEPQISRLRQILADERVTERFVFVITHYAPCLADGGPDRRHHGLANAAEFLAACADLRRGAILCGHVHHRYVAHPIVAGREDAHPEAAGPPVFCAGSTTKRGVEGLWMFDISQDQAVATPGRWGGDGYALETGQSYAW